MEEPMVSDNDPAAALKALGLHIPQEEIAEHRHRGVTDLITMTLCPRYAHQFSQQRYPAQTPATILGLILHRTIKHLYDRYQIALQSGDTWLPSEAAILEECQIAEEAAYAQGLPRLLPQHKQRLHTMLCTFHAIEAQTFYPRVQAAEVDLQWLWEEAPGGPLLLEGKVDVVLEQSDDPLHPSISIWDYKTTKQPDPGREMESYKRQMQLYAFLYQHYFGHTPQGTVLYFMGELTSLKHPSHRPAKAVVELPVVEQNDEVMQEWLRNVLEKEERYSREGQWLPPDAEYVPEKICKECLIRYSCPSVHFPWPWMGKAAKDDELDGYEP